MRLACQVKVAGDVVVYTRIGGPAVKPNQQWDANNEPSKWKDRWTNRKQAGAGEEAEEAAEE